MAKQDYLFRYFTIIKMLKRNNEATFKEIAEYVQDESGNHDRSFSFSLRTFQRDVDEIRNLFKIDIQYDFSAKVYNIVDDLNSELNNRMLESIDTINSLKMVSDVSKYMFFEKRKAKGTHHFHGLLHAIKNRMVIKLIHQKYDNDEPTQRFVEPYALKESKGRWYLFAKDSGDKKMKTFGLDRVLDFEFTPRHFDYPQNLNVNEIFKYCFGVINPDSAKPEEVILSFDPEQGNYIKSYPIHDSQEILQDNSGELRIKLQLYLTFDLTMEILSYGDSVEVVAPQKLRDEITSINKAVLKIYEKDFLNKPQTLNQ
jgi:predicted DNA-binding transcriptional regulator YafY